MTSHLKLAARLLLREWKSGELSVLVFALVMAIAATTTISFFSERMGRSMLLQASELIGGDLVLQSSRPLDRAWRLKGDEFGLATAETVEFASVLVKDNEILLAHIKAVSDTYPVSGKLRIANKPYADDRPVSGPPETGQAWVDVRVLDRLGASVGDKLAIGSARFTVAKVLTFEPDRAGDFFNLAPRVMVNLTDLEAMQVIRPGSRARYKYLYAGQQSGQMEDWLGLRLGPGHRLYNVAEGRRGAGQALERGKQFLVLTSMMATLLAAVAIAMSLRRYSERHYDACAMLRCLGARQKDVLKIYCWQVGLLALMGGALGCVLGWLMQSLVVFLLEDLIPRSFPQAGFKPLLVGMGTALAIALGVALPPVLRMGAVSPLRVIRRDLMPFPVSARGLQLFALLIWVTMIYLVTGALQIVAALTGGVVLTLLLVTSLSWMLLGWFRRRVQGRHTRLLSGLQRLVRRPAGTVLQLAALVLTLMVGAVIFLLRTELISNWETQLPDDVPNHFVYNIMPHDKDDFVRHLEQHNVRGAILYPMVRGRLIALNGEPVRNVAQDEQGGNGALNREINLTWSEELPGDNRIISGKWWQRADRDQLLVSVEAGLAGRLGAKLGDSLTFDVAASKLVVKVHSLRTVKWESFSPNFFMIFPAGVLEAFSPNYITSFSAKTEVKPLLAGLVSRFPSITILEVDLIVRQLTRVLKQVTLAVEVMLALVLLSGFAVLFAVTLSSMDERLLEGAMMRVLGAGSRQLRIANLMEFGLLGAYAGLVAAVGAELVVFILYQRVFQLDYSPSWPMWLGLPLISAVIIGLVGYCATRQTLKKSPQLILQQH